MSTTKESGIARSAGLIGFATLCSRILGFIRDIIIARLFGVYIYAQAFVVAFKIPNLLRDFVGEGAVNAALVPVFSEYKERHSRQEFWELANVVLNLLLVTVAAITVLGIIFSPAIIRVMAPGFLNDPEKLSATIKLNRLIFPFVLLISLSAYAMGILNSLRHFAIPAFGPCLLNISIIIFALLFGEGIKGLALGILVGGVLQLAVQVPVLYRKGFRLKLFRRFKHPAASQIGKLMLPRVASSSLYQMNNLIDTIFGSLAIVVGEGGVAILYFAYRLIQFPLGIFSTALSQAILPTFSSQALSDGKGELKSTLSWGLRLTFFVLLPASAGLIALSFPIISTLFGGRKFDAYSVSMTSQALTFYSIGLFSYGATKILQSCFFSLRDTITPAKVSFLGLCLNVVLNIILMFPLKIAGLALATSISGIICFLVLFFLLQKKLGDFQGGRIWTSFFKISILSVCMAVACYYISKNIFPGAKLLSKVLNLSFSIISGIFFYVLLCFIFRFEQVGYLRRFFKKNG